MKRLLILFVFAALFMGSQAQVIEPWVTANKVQLSRNATDSVDGSFWWDGTTLYIYDGSTWYSSAGGDSSFFDLSGTTLTTKTGIDEFNVNGNAVVQDSLLVWRYMKVGSDTRNVDGVLAFEASDGDASTIYITTADKIIFGGNLGVSFSELSIVNGSRAISMGNGCVSNGDLSFTQGFQSRSDGGGSFAIGNNSYATMAYQFSHAAGKFSTVGDAQTSQLVAKTDTTHSAATWFPLYLNGSSEQMTISASTVWTFEITISGTDDAQSKTFSYKITGQVESDAAGTETINAQSVTTIYESDSDFDARVQMSGDNFQIQVQDATSGGDKVRWVARIELTEVSF